MDTGLLEAERPVSREICTAEKDPVAAQVRCLLASTNPTAQVVERRRDQRYAYSQLVVLTAVSDDGVTPLEEKSCVVVGKQISERGLGFFHPEPLPYRRVIASMELEAGRWISFLLDVSWCRFTRYGWYESGGRFLHVAELPPGVEKTVAS